LKYDTAKEGFVSRFYLFFLAAGFEPNTLEHLLVLAEKDKLIELLSLQLEQAHADREYLKHENNDLVKDLERIVSGSFVFDHAEIIPLFDFLGYEGSESTVRS
jgi:hypothetical protein